MRKNNLDDKDKSWVGEIITFTGKSFNIQRPTPNSVDIVDIAHALSMLCRYNGHVPTFYSVAEHSIRVAQQLDETGHTDLVFAGLLHDAAEAYVGDMVHPMKQLPELGRLFKAYEEGIEYVVGERFNVQLTPMNPIVKAADIAVYEWEIENIRTGKSVGLLPHKAREEFLEAFLEFGGMDYV